MTAHQFSAAQAAHFNSLANSTLMCAFVRDVLQPEPTDPPVSLVEALMDTLDTTEAAELERAIYRAAIRQAFEQVNAAKARVLNRYLEGDVG